MHTSTTIQLTTATGNDAYTLGGTVKIFGVGISVGGFVTGLPFLPETTKENFDIGGYISVSPGPAADLLTKITGDEAKPTFSSGLNVGRLTVDAGVKWNGREALNGLGFDLEVGAGAYGGTLNLDASSGSSNRPSGLEINYGPQLRASGDINFGGSLSVGDLFTGLYSTLDWATGGGVSAANPGVSNMRSFTSLPTPAPYSSSQERGINPRASK